MAGTQELSKYREKLLKTVNEVAGILLTSYPKDPMETLMSGMEIVGRCLDVDRVQIWRNEMIKGELNFVMRYEWLSELGKQKIEVPIGLAYPYSTVPGWYEMFMRGGYINSPISLLPSNVASFLGYYEMAAIVILPMFINDDFIGFFSVDDCGNERTFTDDEMEMLSSTGIMFASMFNRIHQQKKLTEAEERVKLMLDSSPLSCSLWDKKANIIDCNQASLELFELKDKQEFIDNFLKLCPEYQPEGVRSYKKIKELLNRAFEEGRCVFEWMHRTFDDTYIPCEVTLVRVKHGDGYVVAAYTRDLREYKKMMNQIESRTYLLEEALDEAVSAARIKSNFLSAMSHEMRTPMNAILGMTGVAKKEREINQKNLALGKIEAASHHLLGIINDVLDMSKIEANKLRMQHEGFDLEGMINKVTSLVRFLMDDKKHDFSVNLDGNLPPYYKGDEQRLTQVISNLLSNAAIYTPDEGKISLDVSLVEEKDGICKLRFEISDNGIGIPSEKQKTIFQMFEQADGGMRRSYGGTGLGLTISKSLVELMGGNIHVESEMGKGSRFIFTVKLEQIEKIEIKPKPNPVLDFSAQKTNKPDGKSDVKKILIAEDIEINREIIISMLDDVGLSADVARNGREAVDMVAANPDLYKMVLMDVQMPEMDGLEATRHIRTLPISNAKQLPIIAITAHVFTEDVEQCLAAGMNDHIGKPIDMSVFIETLQKYMDLEFCA